MATKYVQNSLNPFFLALKKKKQDNFPLLGLILKDKIGF